MLITHQPKHQLAFSVPVLLSARLPQRSAGAESDGNGDLICINDNHMERVCVIYCSGGMETTPRTPRKDSASDVGSPCWTLREGDMDRAAKRSKVTQDIWDHSRFSERCFTSTKKKILISFYIRRSAERIRVKSRILLPW